MIGQGVARRYARALFEAGSGRGALRALEGELAGVVSALETDDAFRRVLFHPLIPAGDKARVVAERFGTRVSGVMGAFLDLVVRKKRERILPAILAEYRRLVDAAENVVEAEAILPAPPAERFREEIRLALERCTGKTVRLSVSVDPRLLGGMVLQMGDKRIDGSLRGRLERLRGAIASAPLRPRRDGAAREPGGQGVTAR